MLTFTETAKKIQVQKQVGTATLTIGMIELSTAEKSFTTNGTQKIIAAEIEEIKAYTDNHNF